MNMPEARGLQSVSKPGNQSNMKKMLFAATAALSLVACSSSNNIVMVPNTSDYAASAVALEYDGGTVEVEDGKVALLEKYLRNHLFDDGSAFAEGMNGLTIKYGFIGYEEGSQAARYLAGPIAGGAKMVIVAEFFDAEGNSLSKIQSEGTVSGGFFGGDSDSAINGAAKKIAGYAKENFAGK